jgi:hypothetical protein
MANSLHYYGEHRSLSQAFLIHKMFQMAPLPSNCHYIYDWDQIQDLLNAKPESSTAFEPGIQRALRSIRNIITNFEMINLSAWSKAEVGPTPKGRVIKLHKKMNNCQWVEKGTDSCVRLKHAGSLKISLSRTG